MTNAWTSTIRAAAIRYSIRPQLLTAQVDKESAGRPWAWNPEPAYRYLWDVRHKRPFRVLTVAERMSENPPADFPTLAGDRDQEWWAQQASWGLLQVLGAVARELGFEGPYLSELCDPYTGIEFGARKLHSLLRWSNGDERTALAAYNGGSGNNPLGGPLRQAAYADDVLRRAQSITI